MKKETTINQKVIVNLPDIACTSCASVIELHFNKLKDITVSINFGTRKAYFTYDRAKWSETQIIKEMKVIGYKVADFEENGQVKHYGHSDVHHKKIEETHQHTSNEHSQHFETYHHNGHFHNFKLRDLIEVIIGVVLLMPLLFIMIPNTPWLDPLRNSYVQLSLTTIILFYIGRKFYIGLYRELIQQKWPGMYSLIAFGTLTAYTFSIYLIVVNKTEDLFFEAAAAIVIIVLLGDLITSFIQSKAVNGLESLMNLSSKEVLLVDKKTKKQVMTKVENIQLNDILIVRKGEAIPTDGTLISKQALINEALITGEAKIIIKKKNVSLIGGTINVGDNFEMKATKIGKDTILASIISAVDQAQAQKPKLQKIADKVARLFTPIIIIISFLVFAIRFWVFGNSLDLAIETAIASLIIACPCALGIATPLAVAVGVNKAAKLGVIYNQASAFEKITKIDTVCFDKTGTLTTGDLTITKIYGDPTNLKLAISLEKYSTHPIAKAFNAYSLKEEQKIVEIKTVKEDIGSQISGRWSDKTLVMSSLSKLLKQKMTLKEGLLVEDLNSNDSKILIALAINNIIVNVFLLEDTLQLNAINTIKKLQRKNIEVILISGDKQQIVEETANKLKINKFFADARPIDKASIVKKLQLEGKKVAFVGDGVNDSVALKQADLAIAMGSGSDIAKRNGDITIANNNINAIYQAIVLTKKTRNNIWLNFAWAFGYNIVIIPLAALGFIIPTLAAVAMALSDLTVVGNSLVFKWRKYRFD